MYQSVLFQNCNTLVQRLAQNQNIFTISLPDKNPDLVPIEHVYDIFRRNIRYHNDARTSRLMITALHREWATSSQNDNRIVIGLMCRQSTHCLYVV